MPFKSGKSPTDVAKKLNKTLTQDLPLDIEKGLFSMYTILSGTADYYVPVDTSALVQSRTSRIRKAGDNYRLTYGYYTEYAQYLHESRNWEPKPPGTPGKPNGGYNPNAKPGWLNLAWNEAGDEARKAFARIIEPK